MKQFFRSRLQGLKGHFLRNGLLLVVTALLSFSALSLPVALRQTSFPLKVGDVATQDIQAPFSHSYESSVLTAQARVDAEKNVQNIYQSSDPTLTRKQIEKLRVTLNFISSVKVDGFSTPEQKLNDLNALVDFRPTKTVTESLLAINDSRWQIIQQEAVSVLEQVMRNTIREGQEALATRNIPSLISYSIPQDQATLIYELVTPFVAPNSLFDKDATEAARKVARDGVTPVVKTYIAGESIVRRGQLVTALSLEALQAFGLVEEQTGIQNSLATLAIVAVTFASAGLYFYRRKFSSLYEFIRLMILAIFFLIFLFGVRFIIPNRTVLPYLFPAPAFGMTIGSLFPSEVGVILSLALSILAGYSMPNGFELTLFYFLSSLFGIAILGKGRRIMSFFWSGLGIGLAGSAVVLAFRLADTTTDGIGIATLVGVSFVNGLASASLTLLFQYIFAQMLGMVTPLQLLDLSRPDHPLLQFLLRNAPGTYQHSLQVANLTEQAAEAIGADSLLVRVGCLYHDIGKAANPTFFIENQVPGNINPHDDIQPMQAAQIIIQHVTDGILLARRFRIPPRIQDFIREHHGTLLARYHYTRAIQAADNDPSQVDSSLFRYPGPRPRSRETALLMLADGSEARFRAENPKTDDDLRKLVKKVFDFLQAEGQMDDTILTLRDLHQVTEVFVTTIKNTYHPRLQYPELKAGAGKEPITQPLENK